MAILLSSFGRSSNDLGIEFVWNTSMPSLILVLFKIAPRAKSSKERNRGKFLNSYLACIATCCLLRLNCAKASFGSIGASFAAGEVEEDDDDDDDDDWVVEVDPVDEAAPAEVEEDDEDDDDDDPPVPVLSSDFAEVF